MKCMIKYSKLKNRHWVISDFGSNSTEQVTPKGGESRDPFLGNEYYRPLAEDAGKPLGLGTVLPPHTCVFWALRRAGGKPT